MKTANFSPVTSPRVRLATPVANGVEPHGEYTRSLHELIRAHEKGLLPFALDILRLPCSHLPSGRDKLVRAMRDGMGGISPTISNKISQSVFDFDFLLFLDADQDLTVGQAVHLFDECKKHGGPVAAVTHPRGCRGFLNAGPWRDGIPGMVQLTPAPQKRGTRVVDWAGTGCMMIPSDVFRALPFPWFRDRVIYAGEEEAFYTGEDVGFCISCGEHGIPIRAAFGIYVNHYTGEDIPPGSTATTKKEMEMATAKKKAPVAAPAIAPAPAPQAPVMGPQAAPRPQQYPASVQMAKMARDCGQDWNTAITWMENAEGALTQALAQVQALQAEVAALKGAATPPAA